MSMHKQENPCANSKQYNQLNHHHPHMERLQLLNESLMALLETLQPTAEADETRRAVVADMQQLVSQTLPPELHCSLETFGSYRAGLHLPGSDLDFALTGWVSAPTQNPEGAGADAETQQRQVELHEFNMLEQQYLVERVLNARVPVIKFTHKQSGLACDFSICRPECTFKADMQKLLGSLDRRYPTLYRLVKAWAAAHGLNDAAANTFNSWSLGLLVAFYLQCGTSPAVLPPIWQLLEKEEPHVWEPRVLQMPHITSAALRRVVNQAATGAGALAARRAREGSAALNPSTIGELLSGFFAFYTPALADWAQGRNSSRRASTWWGEWKEAPWPGLKAYIIGIEDPFNAGDNTARAVGTHNHLSSCKTATYIASTFATSHQLLQLALDSDGASTAAAAAAAAAGQPPEHGILSAFAWLFGPHAVLQLERLPPSLSAHLLQQLPPKTCSDLQQQLQQLHDCMELLSCSSSLINKDNRSIHTDESKVAQIEQALGVYRQLTQGLGCAEEHHVCFGDHLAHRRVVEQREAAERERKRQEQLAEWEQQRREAMLVRAGLGGVGVGGVGGQAGSGELQHQEQQELSRVLAASMQGLQLSGSSSGRNPRQQQQQQQGRGQQGRRRQPSGPQQQQREVWRAVLSGDGSVESSSPSSSRSSNRGQGGSRREASAPPDLPQQHVSLHKHHHHQPPPPLQQQQQYGVSRSRSDASSSRPFDKLPAPAAVSSSAAFGGSRLAASALAGVVGGSGSGGTKDSARPRNGFDGSSPNSNSGVVGGGSVVPSGSSSSSSRQRQKQQQDGSSADATW